jgi:hypothetical protein
VLPPAASGDTLVVTLTADTLLALRSAGAAVAYEAREGSVVVRRAEGAAGRVRYELAVPRAAPRVEVRAGTSRVLRIEGGRPTPAAPAAPRDTWRVPLAVTNGGG